MNFIKFCWTWSVKIDAYEIIKYQNLEYSQNYFNHKKKNVFTWTTESPFTIFTSSNYTLASPMSNSFNWGIAMTYINPYEYWPMGWLFSLSCVFLATRLKTGSLSIPYYNRENFRQNSLQIYRSLNRYLKLPRLTDMR